MGGWIKGISIDQDIFPPIKRLTYRFNYEVQRTLSMFDISLKTCHLPLHKSILKSRQISLSSRKSIGLVTKNSLREDLKKKASTPAIFPSG